MKSVEHMSQRFDVYKKPEFVNEKFKQKLKGMILEEIERNKEREFFLNSTFFKVGFSCAAVILILFLVALPYVFKAIGSEAVTNTYLTGVTGDVTVTKAGKEAITFNNLPGKTYYFNPGDIIRTGTNSFANIGIGSNSFCTINDLSEFAIVSNDKIDENEITKLLLHKGNVDCEIHLPSSDSVFEIVSEVVTFSVKGTIFSVGYLPGNNMRLNVGEGAVEIIHNISDFSSIEEIDRDVYNAVLQVKQNKIITKNDKPVIIKTNEIKKINTLINNLIEDTVDKTSRVIEPSAKEMLISEINSLKKSHEILMSSVDTDGTVIINEKPADIENEVGNDEIISEKLLDEDSVAHTDYQRFIDKKVIIKTYNGNKFIGTLVAVDKDDIVTVATSLGNISIKREKIITIDFADK